MRRPEVSLDNYIDVYRFYDSHHQSQFFAQVAHRALARVYKAKITCSDGVRNTLHSELSQGSRLILAPNHTSADDQYVVASLARRLPELRPLIGNTIIPTEPFLLNRKGVAGRMLRRSADGLGSIPAFRKKDLERLDPSIESADKEVLYRKAMIMAQDVQISKMVRGSHMAGFLEGERNRIDYRRLQLLKNGMGYTAIEVAKSARVLFVPVGFYFGGEPIDYTELVFPDKHKPHVHVGMPIPVETHDVSELIAQLHPAIQSCVDLAIHTSST